MTYIPGTTPNSADAEPKSDTNAEAHLLFHCLWSKAREHPDYVKRDWVRLEALLQDLGVRL